VEQLPAFIVLQQKPPALPSSISRLPTNSGSSALGESLLRGLYEERYFLGSLYEVRLSSGTPVSRGSVMFLARSDRRCGRWRAG
jgi:hypothetical protein